MPALAPAFGAPIQTMAVNGHPGLSAHAQLQHGQRPRVVHRSVPRSRKRGRAGAGSSQLPAAQCLDSTGQEALMALERRLQGMRLQKAPGAQPARPHRLAALPDAPKHVTEARASETGNSPVRSSVEDAPHSLAPHRPGARHGTMQGPPARRPRFMKPLVAMDNSPSVPLTPTRPNQPHPTARPGFASPRRPVSASMPTRRQAPSILKRRRVRSATTRKSAVAKDDFVPDGMMVSLPPLLPTHSLLADAYTQGYDCGVSDGVDMEVDTDTEEMTMGLGGSLTGYGGLASSLTGCGNGLANSLTGAATHTDRPSVAVPSNFVQDMLVSLDDSLEEGGFQELLREARRATSSDDNTPTSAPVLDTPVRDLGDSPDLCLDPLSPSVWHTANTGNAGAPSQPHSPALFDTLRSFDGMFGFPDFSDSVAMPMAADM